MGIDFHHRIRAGFLAIAKREPERCAVVDAVGEAEEIHKKIMEIIKSRLM